MFVCGVLRTVLSASFGAIVQILIFLLQNSNILKVQASLPPGAEDEIILIEHLPGRRVHLQDFFWTDAKDAPPWVDPNQGLTFYETRTVHHTVTIYSPVQGKDEEKPVSPDRTDVYGTKCVSCIEPTPRLDEDEERDIGVLIGEDPGPRYWLLTVLRSGETVPPKIELKLARLYKTAFLRQQQRHLGLLQNDSKLRRRPRDESLIKNKPDVISVPNQEETSENPADQEFQVLSTQKSTKISEDFRLKKQSLVQKEILLNKNTSKEMDYLNESSAGYTNASYNLSRILLSDHLKQVSNNIDTDERNASKRSELRSLNRSGEETVQVQMHNTTVTESGATKLIYSVHLGGKPVPAETAARDMALLSSQEVALELGAPVIIQSEPYLKETQPLALSRKRDAWLLIGAASAGVLLLILVVAGLILAAKRKRAHSAVVAPPSHHILKKKRDYIPATDADNAFSTSEVEAKTDGTSHRQTPGSLSRTPVSLESQDSLDAGVHEISSDNEEEEKRREREQSPWERPAKRSRLTQARVSRPNIIDTPRTSVSTELIPDQLETFDSLENGYTREDEATASPHSYLSMPSCKQFPSMKSVEPLSRVLEPVMVKHLDIDSPELMRRENDHGGVHRAGEPSDKVFGRSSSAVRDPGVVGPIVWNLRRQHLSTEGNGTSGTDPEETCAPSGSVGRARRRLHELLEDSFSLFGTRDTKTDAQPSGTRLTSGPHGQDVLTIFSETGRSNLSPTSVPIRPRTSLPGKQIEERLPTQSGWGSRPLSAGPFHRPSLPNVDTRRILTDSQLAAEDPAVPLIASIKKELERFSPN